MSEIKDIWGEINCIMGCEIITSGKGNIDRVAKSLIFVIKIILTEYEMFRPKINGM